MKLIEGLKKIKDLQRKSDDLIKLVHDHCALSSVDTPKYKDQEKQVNEWIQAHSDIQKEILALRIAIQKTNLKTEVSIELNGKVVTKTIAEWIHRRRDLSGNELRMWQILGDRGIQEGFAKSPGGEQMEIKIIRYYRPDERDRRIDQFQSEPMIIDSTLEVANALTDIIE